MQFLCPICQQLLNAHNSSWQCANRHHFDVAKEGYINLLPVNKKHSKDPGDSKEMMAARRLFLESGHYQPLIERIIALVQQFDLKPTATLDIGCGEGYYSSRLFKQVQGDFVGIDISRSAVRYAAKRYAEIQFAVASAFDLPLADDEFDLILRIFAPGSDQQIARVCKENGIFINVSAGPKHHFAVKKLIYDEPRLHPERDTQLVGFNKIHQERLQWNMTLPAGEICAAFLQMTPYAWKFSEQQKNELKQAGLICEIDFNIEIFKKSR
ncbi:23S rRNA (guanine(745)-N(1))-methyltransferase [Shewanella avicenniae]|uniref:23S rRNA (Guanine(745)-N(1))-methyltransferase n=1 Tax=Shewanella avicenniae TaxID=2814294 RepID=A0ABX7QWN8_9GAMM|nr:23S rRNA (guanine(745)-N(1))-methyltransferase [Shewanella avicenniae]QSX35076.1 23S rRNA (guanine(745)-N(1))-methyltransferase [Shewanella avicenniae]